MEFDTAIKNSVLLSTIRPKYKNIYTNRKVLRLRAILWRKYCITHCSLDYDRFSRVHKELWSITLSLKCNFEKGLVNSIIKYNLKVFWK